MQYSSHVVYSVLVVVLALALAPPEICAQPQPFHGASIQKSPFGPSGAPKAHVGDTITAFIRVRNLDDLNDSLVITSIVDVVHHSIGDETSPNLLAGPVLLPGFGDSVTVSNTYLVLPGDPDVLQDDAQAGGIDNHDGSNGSNLKQNFFVTFPGQVRVVRPCIRISKSCANAVGEDGAIQWSGTLVNCGNGVLTNVVVSNFVNGAWSSVFPPAVLTNGQSYAGRVPPSDTLVIITVPPGTNHVLTEGESAALLVGETVFLTGSYPGGCAPTTDTLLASGTDELGLTVTNSASATCSNLITAGIAVTKKCPANAVQPGGVLTFTGSVSNTGNVTLTNVVVVNDQPAPNTLVFGPVTLAPGQSRAFTNSYTTPTAVCGPWIDTLTARAISTCGMAVTNTATATCPSATIASVVVRKFCPVAPVAPGELLVFRGFVSNSGNVSLTNVLVVNNRPTNDTPVFGPVTLAPGGVRFFTNSYRVTADACGPWVDTLNATARSICGSNANSSSTAICAAFTTPRISITKQCPPSPTPAGSLLVYSGIVSNSGNVTLTNVFVVDNKPTNNTPVLGPITLAPGQFARFTNSYLVPGEDCCGPYIDTLTASGRDKCTGSNVIKTASAVCPALTLPALCITRTCPPEPIIVGQPITYSGIVSNCGNVGLSNVVVIDGNGNIIMQMQGFNIGEWMDYTGTFTPGNCGPNVTNVITITGRDICSGASVSRTATCILDCAAGQLIIVNPTLIVTKFGFSFQSLPQKTYTVQFINSLTPPITGWQTLSNMNGNGSMLHVEDSLSPTQRYYRVLQNP